MMNKVKTQSEIAALRISGRMLAEVLDEVFEYVQPGISTYELAEIARKELKSRGGKPSFLGYHGFPHVICTSVNEEVIHGIPSRNRVLQTGDLLSLDFGVTYDGMITDSARTVVVDKPASPRVRELLSLTQKSLEAGIAAARGGVHVAEISAAIEKVLLPGRFGIVRDFVGHGVGHQVHEEPNVPNYTSGDKGPLLKSGMTLAIEPMATLGTDQVRILDDDWTVVTLDGSLSAHFEHTVLLTDQGAEVLTLS